MNVFDQQQYHMGHSRPWSGAELELLFLLIVEEGQFQAADEWGDGQLVEIEAHILRQQRDRLLCKSCRNLLYNTTDYYDSIRYQVFRKQASGPVTIEGNTVYIDIKQKARQ